MNILTPEKIEEFNQLKAWVKKCPIEAAMRIEKLKEENKKLREADKIVKVLYVGLGMNVDGDLKLWKKTEAYVKSSEETK